MKSIMIKNKKPIFMGLAISFAMAASIGKSYILDNSDELIGKAVKSSSTIPLSALGIIGRNDHNFRQNLVSAIKENLKKNDFVAFDRLVEQVQNNLEVYGASEDFVANPLLYGLGHRFGLLQAQDPVAVLNHLAKKYPIYFKQMGGFLVRGVMDSELKNQKELAEFTVQNAEISDKNSYLYLALGESNFVFADTLIAHGIKPTPLEIAQMMKHFHFNGEGMSWLKKQGINIHGNDFAMTMMAAHTDNLEALKFLMDNGARRQDVIDRALKEAVQGSREYHFNNKVISYLLDQGAQADATTVKSLDRMPIVPLILEIGKHADKSKKVQIATTLKPAP